MLSKIETYWVGLLCVFLGSFFPNVSVAHNDKFVYLRSFDPSILQDIRYATSYNFVGHPIRGYSAQECILTEHAARALSKVQHTLQRQGLSLLVYDCYRPVSAVEEFATWSQNSQQDMKKIFYPAVNKHELFALDYIAIFSGHSRGSTIDLTITDNTRLQKIHPHPCTEGPDDGSLDMGTSFDCFDNLANLSARDLTPTQKSHRKILHQAMKKFGFKPYAQEWWHFTYAQESYPNQYFNFPILPKKFAP